MRKCIEAGIKPPRHFGEAQLQQLFPHQTWSILESGPVTMHVVPLIGTGRYEPIPSFYAIIRQQTASA